MLQLLARTICIQDPNFKSWMLSPNDGFVWPFYKYRLFLKFLFIICLFHERILPAILPRSFVTAMFLTCSEVTINISVALLLTSFTTCHTFQIEVHHRFPLALGVTFCLAIASDCKFFHITPKFYVYLTTAPGGNK